ncbi:hypothetical protein BDZ89DRAFT_1080850 [Hymenopellis radicata]|nr:hypothetical protein BDZ89DRAFT_1080850 [Hymenopellis radicata]
MSTTMPSEGAHTTPPTDPTTTSTIAQPITAPKNSAETISSNDEAVTDNSGGDSAQSQTTSTTTTTGVAEPTGQGYSLSKLEKEYLRLEFAQEYMTFVQDSSKKGSQKKWIVQTVLLPFLDKFYEGEMSPPIEAISKCICRHFYNSHKNWAGLRDTTLVKPKPRCISGKRAYQLANKELVERRARLLKKEHEARIAEAQASGKEVAKDPRSEEGWHHRGLLAAWNDCPDQKKYEDEARAFNDSIKDGPELSSVYARQGMLGAIIESVLKPLIGFGHNGVGKIAFGVQVGYEDAQGHYQYHDQFILPDPDWLKLTPTGNIITEDTRKNFADMVTAGFSLAKNPEPTDGQLKGTPAPQDTSTTKASSPATSTPIAPADPPSGPMDVAPVTPSSPKPPSTTSSNDETLAARREAEAKERELAIREAEEMKMKKGIEEAAAKQTKIQAVMEKKRQAQAKKTRDMLVSDAANLASALADATSSNETGELAGPVSSANEDVEAKLKAADMDLSKDDDDEASDGEDFEAKLRAVEMELDLSDDEEEPSAAEPLMPPPPAPAHVDASTAKAPEVVHAGDEQSVPESAPQDDVDDAQDEVDDASVEAETVEDIGKKRGTRSTKRKAVEAPADEPAAKAVKRSTRMTRASNRKAEEEAELQKKQAAKEKRSAAAAKKKADEEKKGTKTTARRSRRR